MENKIILPEGFVVDFENSTDTEIVIKKIEEKKALTWKEIQEENKKGESLFINISSVSNGNMYLGAASKYVKSQLPTGHIAEKVLALCQMHVIADYYNRVYADGWVADWKDKDQDKWYVSWDNDIDVIVTASLYALSDTFPVFASEELIQMAYHNNIEIFEKALKP